MSKKIYEDARCNLELNEEGKALISKDKLRVLKFNKENLDIRSWINTYTSMTSYESNLGTISTMTENGELETESCIISLIKTDATHYKLWVLYHDTTSENFYLPASEVKKPRKKPNSNSVLARKLKAKSAC